MTVSPESEHTLAWWHDLTPRKVAQGVLLVLLVLFGFALLLWLRDVLALLFIGIVLATAARPLFGRLRDLKIPRVVAAFLATLTIVGALGGLIAALAPFLVLQGRALLAQAPAYYETLRESLVDSRYPLVRSLGVRLPFTLGSGNAAEQDTLLTQLAAWGPSLFSTLIALLGALLFSYYWLLYRERAVQALALLLPIDWRERGRELWEQSEGKIGAFVRGQLLLGLSVGLLSLAGYWLVGLPYAVLLAIIAGVMELIPVVGPIIAALPALAVGLSVSPEHGIYALLVATLVQQLENNLLVPRIMDRTVGVSPVVSFVALIAFVALFGFVGALLAIPLAAVIQVLLDAWLSRSVPDAAAIEGRDDLALLRYQALDLTQDLRDHLRAAQPTADADAEYVEEELEAIIGAVDELLAEASAERAALNGSARERVVSLP
jgi:predicted PurR-regulated permease PerM